MLDGVVIYDATHLLELMSFVNSNIVKNITIYKGAFPARYGGRISSIWDISLKNGNPERIHGNLCIGSLASDFMVEGPLIKNKTTFAISGRRSYHDYFARIFTPGLTFYFQDLNVKVSHRLSEKDRLYFSTYISRDKFELKSDSIDMGEIKYPFTVQRLDARNQAAVLGWKHDHSEALHTNFSLMYSDYQVSTETSYQYLLDRDGKTWTGNSKGTSGTGQYDLAANFRLSYEISPANSLEAGVTYTKHTWRPHTYLIRSEDVLIVPIRKDYPPVIRSSEIWNKPADEMTLYAEQKRRLFSRMNASWGLHLSRYASGKVSYYSLQPRVNVNYQLPRSLFLNLAYSRMQQNLHRMSVSATSLPTNYWLPATDSIKPQIADQVGLSLSGKLMGGMLGFSVETYYKRVDNVLEYLEFRTSDTGIIMGHGSWTSKVTAGKSTSYGLELSIRKSKGNFRGWLSYTLSWSDLTMPEVNNGLSFPYRYNRRHNLNLVGTYKCGKHLELSASFSFPEQTRYPDPNHKNGRYGCLHAIRG